MSDQAVWESGYSGNVLHRPDCPKLDKYNPEIRSKFVGELRPIREWLKVERLMIEAVGSRGSVRFCSCMG